MTYLKANMLRTMDSSYMESASLCSILAARVVPPVGGATEVVSTRAAYEALPTDLKATVDGLTVVHSLSYARDKMDKSILTDEQRAAAPVKHPLVQVNPANGKKSLLIGAHAAFIDGWSEADSRALLDELLDRDDTSGSDLFPYLAGRRRSGLGQSVDFAPRNAIRIAQVSPTSRTDDHHRLVAGRGLKREF